MTSPAIAAPTPNASLAAAPARALHYALWVVQVLLAAAFTMSGLMKLTTPYELLSAQMPWAASVPSFVPALAGGAELLGAIGLVLPSATRILPRLTSAAAVGLVAVMSLAAILHGTLGEFGMVPVNVVLGGLAAFVAWGRAMGAPIAARS